MCSETSNFLPNIDRNHTGLSLPKIATYNLRSLLPKVNSLKTDIIERNIDIAFLQEIWEDSDNVRFQEEVEKMYELHNLKYASAPRPKVKLKNKRNAAYGGAAIIVNTSRFSFKNLNVKVPNGLEVIWGLVKPKFEVSKFRSIIVCSFYSPPGEGKNTKLADHITTTLHMICTQNPDSGLILGADINAMKISPILNCGLKLRQIVDQPTRGRRILDVLITNLGSYYKSPVIAPPIEPDDTSSGEPSDHAVPVCTPHFVPKTRPARRYKKINFRPLPDSHVRKFGEWIVNESWSSVGNIASPTNQAEELDELLNDKLDLFCPKKTLKLSNKDKPFITTELKTIDRKRRREYARNGKSLKYYELKKKFQSLYKIEAKKYMQKQVDSLIQSNPSKTYQILKRLGSHSDDNIDDLSLSGHESLSADESAERIAEYFSEISGGLPKLSVDSLSLQVKDKLSNPGCAPEVSEFDVYNKIKQAKKPKSGTKSDLPRNIINEFKVEIATPLTKIINNIFSSGEWPKHWKVEHVVPVPKVPIPESEDDLCHISLEVMGPKIDFRQYGGLKGNSVNHYVIDFINFA